MAVVEGFRNALGLDVRAWRVTESGREPVGSAPPPERPPAGPHRAADGASPPEKSFQIELGEDSALHVQVACPDGRRPAADLLEATLRRTCGLARVAGEQVSREMHLAHDLQLKLIPPIPRIQGVEASARVVPAASVGGDFYQVVALSGGRAGVMIGDVSGHGLPAALVMAHAISAAVISAEGGDRPAAVMERIHHAIGDELESTEMFVTLFYAVLSPGEPRRGARADAAPARLVYSNAGHAHAFVVSGDAAPRRLGATEPPMGIASPPFAEAAAPWRSGEDLLLLFTDGLSDTLASSRRQDGEARVVSMAARHCARPPEFVLQRLFDMRAPARPLLADDRTAVLVRASPPGPAS